MVSPNRERQTKMKKALKTLAITATAIGSIIATATASADTPQHLTFVNADVTTIEVPSHRTIDGNHKINCENGLVTINGISHDETNILDFSNSHIPNNLVTIGNYDVEGLSNIWQEVTCESGELTRVGFENVAWNVE